MKKTAILFLVLAIIFSFVGCTASTAGEDTTTTTSTTEALKSDPIFEEIDTAFETKSDIGLFNIKTSLGETLKNELDAKITSLPKEDRPSFCVIEFLPAFLPTPEEDTNITLIITWKAISINNTIESSIANGFSEAHYWINSVSQADLSEIVYTKLDEAGKFTEDGLSKTYYSTSPIKAEEDNGCRLSIYN